MQIIEMNLEELKPYENNPRVNDRAVEVVAESIKEFGFKNPIIVDKNNVIVAGHTRFRASKRLGIERVPVIIADDLTDAQIKAFRIMDNKSSEFAEWDYEMLLKEVEELKLDNYDVDLTGFSEFELSELLDEEIEEEEKKAKEQKGEIEFTEELLEEHQYVVLYFDNSLDWQVAKEVFELKTVKALDSREGFEKEGIGRVVKGNKYLERLRNGEGEN